MTLLLKDDPALVSRYKREHRQVWPEVVELLRKSGITAIHIFLGGRRLFMYMEAVDAFDPTIDFAGLSANSQYAKWDSLMRTMQERAPEASNDEWWAQLEEVFDLGW